MRIYHALRNWWIRNQRHTIRELCREFILQRQVEELTRQLTRAYRFKHNTVIDSRNALTSTPMLFRLELTIMLSTTYHMTITVQDIMILGSLEEIVRMILWRQNRRRKHLAGTLPYSTTSRSGVFVRR